MPWLSAILKIIVKNCRPLDSILDDQPIVDIDVRVNATPSHVEESESSATTSITVSYQLDLRRLRDKPSNTGDRAKLAEILNAVFPAPKIDEAASDSKSHDLGDFQVIFRKEQFGYS